MNNDVADSKEPRSAKALLARCFKGNEWWVAQAVAGFAEADWHVRAGEVVSSAAWIMGHLAWSRRCAARAVGVVIAEAPWEAAHMPGANPNANGDAATAMGSLSPSEAHADFVATGRKLRERLKSMSDADVAADAPQPTPDGGRDIASVLSFLQFHEAYHAGQLVLIRRLLGKVRIS